MLNLNPLSLNQSDGFNQIVNLKKTKTKTVLLKIAARVLNRLKDYRAQRGSLEFVYVEEWEDIEKDALIGCYKIRSEVLSEIKASIINKNNTNRCQYCGISPIKPFDHFLPKSLFPEFSFFHLNLVPCCSDCNNKKGELWLKEKERQFINFYFDPVNSWERFLFCEVVVKNHGVFSPNFYLFFSKNIDKRTRQIIEKHFFNLELLKRYARNSNEEISSKQDDVVNTYKWEANLPSSTLLFTKIKQKLLDDAESKRERLGKNSWLAALNEGLANSEEFIYFCIKKINDFRKGMLDC